jgi:hypothetical protein
MNIIKHLREPRKRKEARKEASDMNSDYEPSVSHVVLTGTGHH